MTAHAPDAAPRPSPGMGLIVLACVVTGIAAYISVGTMLGIEPLYAGFLFSVYFGGIKQSAAQEFGAALLGSLGGVATGALLYWLTARFGTTGLVVALLPIVSAIYALIMQWARLLINDAYMMMLTVAAIPAVQADVRFVGMAAAILLAAALLGSVVLIARRSEHRPR